MFNILSDTLAIAARTDRRETVQATRRKHGQPADKRRQREDAARKLEAVLKRRFLG